MLSDFSTVKFLLDVVKKYSSLFHLLLSCLYSWKGQASSLRVNYLSKLFEMLLQRRFVYSLLFILFIKIFLMWTIFKVFIEFVTISHLFYVLVFLCQEACRILAPRPGIKPTSSSLEDKDLTTRPPGKSPKDGIFISNSLSA